MGSASGIGWILPGLILLGFSQFHDYDIASRRKSVAAGELLTDRIRLSDAVVAKRFASSVDVGSGF